MNISGVQEVWEGAQQGRDKPPVQQGQLTGTRTQLKRQRKRLRSFLAWNIAMGTYLKEIYLLDSVWQSPTQKST